MDVSRHEAPRLDDLGGERGMEKRGATEEGDEAASIGRGAGGAEDKPIRREPLRAETHVIYGAVHFLQVQCINPRQQFSKKGKLASVEAGVEGVEGPGVPSGKRELGGGPTGAWRERARTMTSRCSQMRAPPRLGSAR